MEQPFRSFREDPPSKATRAPLLVYGKWLSIGEVPPCEWVGWEMGYFPDPLDEHPSEYGWGKGKGALCIEPTYWFPIPKVPSV